MCWVRVHSQSSLYLPVPLHTVLYATVYTGWYSTVQYCTLRAYCAYSTVLYPGKLWKLERVCPIRGSEGVSNVHKESGSACKRKTEERKKRYTKDFFLIYLFFCRYDSSDQHGRCRHVPRNRRLLLAHEHHDRCLGVLRRRPLRRTEVWWVSVLLLLRLQMRRELLVPRQ